MFILSGLILEVGEIYFGIFGVRLVFLSFDFLREIIKKTNRPTGRAQAGLRSGGTIYSAAPAPEAQPPRPRQPAPPPAHAAAAGPHRQTLTLAAAAARSAAAASRRRDFRAVFLENR